MITACINYQQSQTMTISPLPFIDQANSVILIGSNSNKISFYTGFVYQIEAYVDPPQLNTVVDVTNCNGCSICLTTGTCISNCNYGQYYSSGNNSCIDCPIICSNCKNSSKCSLCADNNCIQCTSYQQNSCILCETGYVVQNNLCVACNLTSYYDLSSKSCLQCQGLCNACYSSSACITCLENSSLNSSNSCSCNFGYTGSTICIRNNFTASISVDQTNAVYLTFSEPLSRPLQITDINALLNYSIIGFSIIEKTSSYFAINITFKKDVTATSNRVDIYFITNLTSTNNSLLVSSSLEVSLFTSSAIAAQIALQQQVAAAKTLASNGATVGISVVFGSSLMNLNPTSFFDFMNTAEILYSVYLFNIDLYPALTGFLLNLNPTTSIPNIYTFIVDASQSAEIPVKYNKYGYNSNLLVLNAGTESTTITIILSFFIIVSLLSCSSWIKKKLTRLLQYFKYGIFLRF